MSFYAFKGFDKNLKCRDFQYEVGKTYTMDEEPKLCEKGFHFCQRLTDVFSYYPRYYQYFNPGYKTNYRYCLIEVFGDGKYDVDRRKGVTNAIKIIRELTEEEINEIITKEEKEKSCEELLADSISAQHQINLLQYLKEWKDYLVL